ncbi:MAG: PrsW family intramembrane metalloprotease [Phycisphaerae bacterium]|nr:PrsW family intramembrane metalloprotease [Phycisphaerae bacterium]
MQTFPLLALGLLPPLLVASAFLWRMGRRGSRRTALAILALGACLVIASGILQILVARFDGMPLREMWEHSVGRAVLVALLAATTEEPAKLLAVWLLVRRAPGTDPRALVAYGVMAGLGVAAIENPLYVLSARGAMTDAIGTGIARTITWVPMHAACGAILGAALALARAGSAPRSLWIAVGLAIAIALHAASNTASFCLALFGRRDADGAMLACLLGLVATTLTSITCCVVAWLVVGRGEAPDAERASDPLKTDARP